MRLFLSCCAVFALMVVAVGTARASEPATSAHSFSFASIDGGDIHLRDFAGRPMLVVNTASLCGFTPQYDGLQALWERYRDDGLVVLGVPSDNFNQELADEAAVKEFCEVNFSINFPMTAITDVRGAQAHPFFAWVGELAGAPRWNFYKYLIDGDGALVEMYPSNIAPDSRALQADVRRVLAE